MKFLILGIFLVLAVSLTITNVYAAQIIQSPLIVISDTVTPVLEFRDQGSKAFFFQIPDGEKRLELFDGVALLPRLTVANWGGIGIGTTAPLHLLDVVAPSPTISIRSSNGPATLLVEATNGNPQVTLTDKGTSSYQLRIEDGTQKFQLFNLLTASPSITIQNNGNVGIGTTTPAEKLDVAGNIKLSGNLVSDGDICIGTC